MVVDLGQLLLLASGKVGDADADATYCCAAGVD